MGFVPGLVIGVLAVNDNACKTMEKQTVPPQTSCDYPVLLWFPLWTPLDLIKVQEHLLAQLAALSTSACSLLAHRGLLCQPRSHQSFGDVLSQCQVWVSECLWLLWCRQSQFESIIKIHGLTGEKKRLLYTCPVWDLCSQHRAEPRLFRLPSSPASTPAVSVTSLEMQNKMWTLKTLRGFKPTFGLLSGKTLGCPA